MFNQQEDQPNQMTIKILGMSNVKKLIMCVYLMEFEGYSDESIIDQVQKQFGVEINREEISSIVSYLEFETTLASKEVKEI
jgi:hypothetical protein